MNEGKQDSDYQLEIIRSQICCQDIVVTIGSILIHDTDDRESQTFANGL